MNRIKHAIKFCMLVFAGLTCLPLMGRVNAEPGVVFRGGRGPGNGKHIVFVTGDEEYRSEDSMPQLAKILAVHHGFKCTVLFAINKETGEIDPQTVDNIPGLEALDTADLMVIFTRFRELPDGQMKYIIDYTNSGKPIIGLRTATHAFNYKKSKDSPYAKYSFRDEQFEGGYGRQVLGETWINHYGRHQKESTRGLVAEGMENHPIVKGVNDIWGPSDVYGITTLSGDSKPLIMGQVLVGMEPKDEPNPDKKPVPVAWTKTYTGEKGKTARVFTTTMGHADDLKNEGFRRLLVNACYWAMGMEDEIPARSKVDFVGEYNPNQIGMGKHKKGLKPSDHKLPRWVSISTVENGGQARLASGGQEEPAANRLLVHVDKGREEISRNIYGHFSEHLGRCIYGGFWVGEDSPIPNTRGIRNDVVEALRRIKIPVLRWPGGCFADEYHWKDGIGPRDKRPTMVNTHWGGVTENNHFGTHEFLDLCEQLGCEPYICGNVGSGSVLEMQQWVEYITFDGISPMADLRRENGRDKPWKVKYWGVGNENWGCGGGMQPEYYADLYRRYATYLRNFGENRLFKVACGARGSDYDWTEVLMREAGRHMNGLAPHYYCGSGKTKRPATEIDEEDWFAQLQRALRVDEIIASHAAIMDRYDPEKQVAIIFDEWGAWHEVEPGTNPRFLYQQNTLRDALVAGVTLNILNNHCDRVKMANIAQTVNVLQAMILTRGEKMILTPTYHVFEMYKVHQDATMLPIDLECKDYQFGDEKIPALNVSASKDKSGRIHISLCNLDPKSSTELVCRFRADSTGRRRARGKRVSGRVLTADAMTAHNSFDNPQVLSPAAFYDYRLTDDTLRATLPSKSVVVLEIR